MQILKAILTFKEVAGLAASATIIPLMAMSAPALSRKKAGVAKHPVVFGHAGLPINWSPGSAGLPFS
jgi:hypothetical protein